MPAHDIAANTIVTEWAGSASVPFSAAETSDLTAALTDFSEQMTPHIVSDVAMTSAQTHAFLRLRALHYLEDWVSMAARHLRRQTDTAAMWRSATSAGLPIGLRSATLQEKIDLPVLGPQLAVRVAEFLVENPDATMEDLQQINGIGPASLETLKQVSYLDQPALLAFSPALLAFASAPSIASLIALYEASDVDLVYGDWLTLLRRQSEMVARPLAERLVNLIQFVSGQVAVLPLVTRGVLASDAISQLERHQKLLEAQLGSVPGAAELIVNAAYIDAAKSMIDAATDDVSLMVFLGTDSAPVDGGVAPDTLIEALETAHAHADVRVILDQDDLDDPYLSKAINLPLLNRLKAAGIPVKFDEKNVLLHSKVLIADSRYVLVGSHNWTRSGLNSTHEVSLGFDQAVLAQSYQQRFDALWTALPDPA